MKQVEAMRRDWDERARTNAFHAIASWRKDWTNESFFESGEKDYERMVEPFLARQSWKPDGLAMLELGCGAGRMTRAFARRFGRVFALDISQEMLARARQLLPDATNVTWTLGNGADLSAIPDASVDFVFSYIVLQHMPTPELALTYIREMMRVAKNGGSFLFQFNSLREHSMNWQGRLVWSVVDIPWHAGFNGASRALASLFGLDPAFAGKSWRGAALDAATVRATLAAAGGTVEQTEGENTPMTWCSGTKLRAGA